MAVTPLGKSRTGRRPLAAGAVPEHTGKSLSMMAIDIQTVQDGKISETYHMENWLSALRQLRAK
jgi:hypothetical protein